MPNPGPPDVTAIVNASANEAGEPSVDILRSAAHAVDVEGNNLCFSQTKQPG